MATKKKKENPPPDVTLVDVPFAEAEQTARERMGLPPRIVVSRPPDPDADPEEAKDTA